MVGEALPDPYMIGKHVIANCGKFVLLQKIVQQFVVKENKKIIIFSGFDQGPNFVEDLLTTCQESGSASDFLRLDGGTSSAWRNLNIHLFNTDPRYKVFLISIRAGGEGLNLTSSSVVVFLDQDWNPQIMRQAAARVHRIGQRHPVTIFKINSIGTVEEQMERRMAKKTYLAAKVTENMQNPFCSDDLDITGFENQHAANMGENLIASLICQIDVYFSSQQTSTREIEAWDWTTVLEKCAHKQADARETPISISEVDEKAWLDRIERIKTDIFNGSKVNTSSRSFNIYVEETKADLIRAHRRIGKNRVVRIRGYQVSKQSLGCKPGEAVSSLVNSTPSDDKTNKKPKLVHEKVSIPRHRH